MHALIHISYDEPDELSDPEQAEAQAFVKIMGSVLEGHFRPAPVALEGRIIPGSKYWRMPGEGDALLIIRLFPIRVPAIFDVTGAIPSVPSKVALPLRVFLLTSQAVPREAITINGKYQEMRALLPEGSTGEKVDFIEELVFLRMAGAGLTECTTLR